MTEKTEQKSESKDFIQEAVNKAYEESIMRSFKKLNYKRSLANHKLNLKRQKRKTERQNRKRGRHA